MKSQDNIDLKCIDELYHRRMKDFSVIAKYVKDARLAAELTQEQLAEKLGMTKANVSGWENDKHHPSPQQLAALARLSGKRLPEELAPMSGPNMVEETRGHYQLAPYSQKHLIETLVENLATQSADDLRATLLQIELGVLQSKISHTKVYPDPTDRRHAVLPVNLERRGSPILYRPMIGEGGDPEDHLLVREDQPKDEQ